MSSSQFDIIFRGDIVIGQQLAEVKQRLQQLFKSDAAKIDALFTGRPVPLKRNLDEATAQKYRDVLIKAGALVEVVAAGSVNTAPRPAARPAASPTPPPAPAVAAAPALAPAPVAAASPASAPPAAGGWTLAPTGADLGAAQRTVAPLNVDTSYLSLREQAGNLVDEAELEHQPVAVVEVPNLDVAEVGADLISADEKWELPLVEIELEDWEIAPAGSDLIDPAERVQAEPVPVEIGNWDLAPAGSDLGQLKPKVAPVNPDISALKLADNS